jgi:Tol biopolymer transport system component
MQITYFQNPVTGSPDWSPDGRRIVFDSREGERPQLYITSADGGKAVALPTGEGMSVVPHWSPDGRYIYFSSDRTGRMEIWRVSAMGGVPEQITKEGGFAGVLSPDGASIYYSSDNAPVTSLWELRLATGKRTLVTASVIRRAYAPSSQGVYFFSGSTGQDQSSLFFFDKQALGKTVVFRTDRRLGNGITLGTDGHTFYYTQLDVSGRQLLLVSNFWN